MRTPLPTMTRKTESTTRTKQHVIEANAAVEGRETVRLNVELPIELHRAIKMKALQEHRTIKEVVLSLLTDYSHGDWLELKVQASRTGLEDGSNKRIAPDEWANVRTTKKAQRNAL